MQKFRFTTPITSGDWPNQVQISEAEIAAISFNFQKSYTDQGKVLLAVMTQDPVTGRMISSTLYMSGQDILEALCNTPLSSDPNDRLQQRIFTKLTTEQDSTGKVGLPPGQIVNE